MLTKQDHILLAPHFTLYEMTRSGTAIENDIPNRPSKVTVKALEALCQHILEPLRKQFGPIVVSSGYRCEQLNLLVGGQPASQHCRGEAADIVVNSAARGRAMFNYIRQNLDFDQLIWEPIGAKEPRWLHVSYTTRRPNRHSIVGGR
jgi:zinc D-Ala-D-Ala carboxypeptidase